MRRYPGHMGPNKDAMALRHALTPDPFTDSWQQWGHVYAVHGSYSSTLAADAVPANGTTAQTISLSAAPSLNDVLLIGSFSSTLAAAASAGATSVSITASPPVGALLVFGTVVGSFGGDATVLAVSGSGPYTVTLSQGLAYDQASGATVTAALPGYLITALSGTTATISQLQSSWPSGTAVTALKTVDVFLDQSAGIERNSDGTPQLNPNGVPTSLTMAIRYGSWYGAPSVGDYVLVGRSNMSAGGGSDRVVLGVLA